MGSEEVMGWGKGGKNNMYITVEIGIFINLYFIWIQHKKYNNIFWKACCKFLSLNASYELIYIYRIKKTNFILNQNQEK